MKAGSVKAVRSPGRAAFSGLPGSPGAAAANAPIRAVVLIP